MNETVVIEPCNRETIVLDKPKSVIMDATVVLERRKYKMESNKKKYIVVHASLINCLFFSAASW